MKSTPNAFEKDVAQGAIVLAALFRGIEQAASEAHASFTKLNDAWKKVGEKFDNDWDNIIAELAKGPKVDDKPLKVVK